MAVNLNLLTVNALLAAVRGRLSIPRSCYHSKANLISYIEAHADEELLTSLRDAASQNSSRVESRRRRRIEQQATRRVARRMEDERRDTGKFMELPSEDVVRDCYRQFFNATSNKAVEHSVCAVCAREVLVSEEAVHTFPLSALPHPERLVPRHPHIAHDLYRGMLLEPKGVGGFGGDQATLQRAMRGTVSTYELDVDGVTDMLSGNLMPRRPAILASLISITYVGVGALPKTWLQSTFRVRRSVVARALHWLKENNPKYYGNIVISDDILQELPEDDIPSEILGIVRQCTDVGVVDQEGSGYVPQPGDEEDAEEVSDVPEEDAGPGVVPLNVAGVVDTDLSKLKANDLMLWGLANLWKEGKEGGYLVRHGSQPVSDFAGGHVEGTGDDSEWMVPNFIERAFPCLYPYGTGGMEARRPVPVDMREHVRWALQYHDRRFRRHETFPFVVFGILQRRQALGSARVQMRRRNFEQDARILSSITLEQLEKARREEEAHLPITDPAVQLLRRHVHATASRMQGSDQARYQIRSQIWSTVLKFGPPVLWVTWNPSDLHDPLAQVFAGNEIDLDAFVATSGPSVEERARTIAADPYAASKFFHFMVKTILETLLQVRTTTHTVKSAEGVLGRVAAYVGSVESQGRGTLHLHLLLWLRNTPSPEELCRLLQDEEFRSRMVRFIRANIHSYLPGLESAQSVKAIPKESDIAYNRPPHPDAGDYDNQLAAFELRVARAEQVHTCKPRRCLVLKKGRLQCKRRAPFPCSDDDIVLPNGEWRSKRLFGYMNSWLPAVSVNARCNNDIKLLTSGADTRNITFYVACYSAKKQGKSHNLSAILADGFAYHEAHPKPEYLNSLLDQQRLLLFRMANSINREQELAAVMVISYLMGWGDVYRSHSYTPVFWSAFSAALLKEFPTLRKVEQ
ncbi:hypothetical protein OH76DRAFT_1355491 [Lentinus brumalis]|uniref:Uncharacterized protein n=1 Tax=Lentinus brumalis TaxID=2498619 RepID=A0A371D2X2_9APHY|nr:hypothetical protein OH76DRAFT_1355491 [Polyporus brumalis]